MIENNPLMETGLLPPSDTEIEQAILGALLMQGTAFYDISTVLSADCFYKDDHRMIFQAIHDLAMANMSIDMLTVGDQLKKKKQLEQIGGPLFLAQLTQRVATTTHLEDHADIIKDLYCKREIIRISHDSLRKAYDGETESEDLIQSIETDLYTLSSTSTQKDPKTIRVGIKEAIKNMEGYSTGKIVGVKSGFKDLDAVTGGWQKQDLIILGGRPSMGKSQAAIQWIYEAAISSVPTLFFSLEMSLMSISQRLIFMETGISTSDVRAGLTEGQWYSVESAIKQIEKLPLFIDDTAGIGLMEIRSKARRAKMKHDIGLIVVDYLGLMTMLRKYKGATHSEEIGYLNQGLKNLAKELDIPVIVLSQLNRMMETRGNKRPKLSDLRDSGCLTGDTLIYVPNLKKNIRIEDLIHQKNIHILANDFKNNKIMKANKCWYSGDKEVFEIRLLNGQRIAASANHKFLTETGWKELSQLDKDRIGIPISYPDIKKDLIQDYEARLLGHMISNGSCLERLPIRYTLNIEDKDVVPLIIDDAQKSCLNKLKPRLQDYFTDKSKWAVLYLSASYHLTHHLQTPIRIFMERFGLFNKRAKEKFIPNEIFYSSNKIKYEFIKALFTGDGTVYYQNKEGRKSLHIGYSSSSYDLISGLQMLLLSVGIISFITKSENKKAQIWYNLAIPGMSNIELFVKNIGFLSKRKQNKMEYGWEESKNNLHGWNKYSFNESRTICFMPISSITSMGVKPVYDIEVNDLHCFMANGILVHNSTEQDADLVIFIHRPEIYGDPDAEHNVGEFILAKHRNGQLADVKFRHTDNFSRLYNYSNF